MQKTPLGSAIWRAAHIVKAELLNFPRGLVCWYADRWGRYTFLLLWTCGTRQHQNWGDDLNYYFIELATGKRVIRCPNSWLFRRMCIKNYLCIGSTLTFYPLNTTAVWGAGLINHRQNLALKSKPLEILAVRGPLTRQWLLEQGVDCPEVYGDPALLLPRFYTPKVRPRSRFGVVPHYVDLERHPPAMDSLMAWPEVKHIAVRDYRDWRDIVDDIVSCDYVLSTSLHGLIVAEAYGIPSLWVEFETPIAGWEFKFNDFYASIGKAGMTPFRVTETTTLEEIWARRSSWVPARVDMEPLLAVCPFPLRLEGECRLAGPAGRANLCRRL